MMLCLRGAARRGWARLAALHGIRPRWWGPATSRDSVAASALAGNRDGSGAASNWRQPGVPMWRPPPPALHHAYGTASTTATEAKESKKRRGESRRRGSRQRRKRGGAAEEEEGAFAAAAAATTLGIFPPLPAAAGAGGEAAAIDSAVAAAWVAATAEEGGGAGGRSRSSIEGLPHLPAVVMEDDKHPIRDSDISRPAWSVLLRLRSAGHEVFVVGGTVRDILLGRMPKDYDILTSATPAEVRKLFQRCYTVGRVFPVCHVHQEGVIMEVSSFSTNADRTQIPADAATFLAGRHGSSKHLARTLPPKNPLEPTWSAARRENAVHRDFTANALLYEPFSRVVFDYVGGVEDCRQRVLRTIGDPGASFRKDPARMLRAVRLAARAGLELDSETAQALVEHAPRVASLPQGRLAMEVGALLGYGGAARSLELLWRLGLLHLLLPQHAAYLKARRVCADYRRRRKPELLFDLLRSLDGHVHPQRPLDSAVWLAVLAAPLVAKECSLLAARRSKAAKLRQRWQARQQEGQLSQADAAVGSWGQLAAGGDAEASTPADPPQLEQLQEGEDEAGEPALEEGASQPWESEAGAGNGGTSHPGAASSSGGGGGSAAVSRAYVHAYREVARTVLERLLLPLDAAMLRKLGHAEEEAALRQAAAGFLPQAGVGGEGGPEAHGAEEVGKGAKGWRRRLLRQRAARRRAALLGDGEDGMGPGSGSDVLVPCTVPKGAIDKALALLLVEAEMRGRPLRPMRGGDGGAAHAALPPLWADQLEASEQQQQQHRRQHRKLGFEERLVATVLREFDWHRLTQLPC